MSDGPLPALVRRRRPPAIGGLPRSKRGGSRKVQPWPARGNSRPGRRVPERQRPRAESGPLPLLAARRAGVHFGSRLHARAAPLTLQASNFQRWSESGSALLDAHQAGGAKGGDPDLRNRGLSLIDTRPLGRTRGARRSYPWAPDHKAKRAGYSCDAPITKETPTKGRGLPRACTTQQRGGVVHPRCTPEP
jgi:hypothetical protein